MHAPMHGGMGAQTKDSTRELVNPWVNESIGEWVMSEPMSKGTNKQVLVYSVYMDSGVTAVAGTFLRTYDKHVKGMAAETD